MIHNKPFDIHPYVYLIVFPRKHYVYVGMRYANVKKGFSPEEDLGIRYFSSSKDVQYLISKGEKAEYYILFTTDYVEEAEFLENAIFEENSLDYTFLNKRQPKYCKPIASNQYRGVLSSRIPEMKRKEVQKMLETKAVWPLEKLKEVKERQKKGYKKITAERRAQIEEKKKKTIANWPPEKKEAYKKLRATPLKERIDSERYKKYLEKISKSSKKAFEARDEASRRRFVESHKRSYEKYLEKNQLLDSKEVYKNFCSTNYGNSGIANPVYRYHFKNYQICPLYTPSKSKLGELKIHEGVTMKKITIQAFFRDAGVDIAQYEGITSPVEIDISHLNRKTLAFNHKANKAELKKVNKLFIKPSEGKVFRVVSADGLKFFEASGNHAVYTREGYKRLQELPEKLELLSPDGEWIACELKVLEKSTLFLDMEIEDHSNYFSGDLLSHNTTGGYAIKYYSSWRGRITRIDDIKDKGSIVGIVSKVRNTKNKIGIPKREAELELRFASGFDSDNEYLKFVVDLGIVQQRGAWFYQEEWGFKGNGRDSIMNYLRENPDLFASVKNSVNMMLCEETVLDKDKPEDGTDSEELEQEKPLAGED